MSIRNFILDMDGVMYRGKNLIPGSGKFIEQLLARKSPFLFLTNNSEQNPAELVCKLQKMGITNLHEDNFITSAMATAIFLQRQKPDGKAFVIGGDGLRQALCEVGYQLTNQSPDYVVVGKTATFNFEMLAEAANLIRRGAKFIGTNPDVVDPVEEHVEPACGSILAAIEAATDRRPFVVGKPNALMMTIARQKLGARSSETMMIGDRMDTDIVGGLEAGMKTCLVLSGVTTMEMLDEFPYRPDYIFPCVGEIDLESL